MEYKSILNNAHILLAGTTGSGKSTALHSLIYEGVKAYNHNVFSFYLIDLKRVELQEWASIPHCKGLAKTIQEATKLLDNAIHIMERRYKEIEAARLKECRYTHLFVIIDELADLIAVGGKPIIEKIARIGRLGRAAHIHLILATQSPDRRTLPAVIQQNITFCIALRCKTTIESRQVIGIAGAEKLNIGQALTFGTQGFQIISIPYYSPQQREEVRKIAQ